jgi:hypothetical protein
MCGCAQTGFGGLPSLTFEVRPVSRVHQRALPLSSCSQMLLGTTIYCASFKSDEYVPARININIYREKLASPNNLVQHCGHLTAGLKLTKALLLNIH